MSGIFFEISFPGRRHMNVRPVAEPAERNGSHFSQPGLSAMDEVHCRKLFVQFVFLCCVFFLTGCTAFQKSVEPPGGQPPPSSADQEQGQPAAKSLPDVRGTGPFTQPADSDLPAPDDAASTASSADLLPLLTLVADRIAAYEGKMRQWKEFIAESSKIVRDEQFESRTAECQDQLQSLLAGYNRLHEQLISESSGRPVDMSVRGQLHRMEHADINFLESDCQRILQGFREPGGLIAATGTKLLEEIEKNIAGAMTAGDYEQVAALYEQMPKGEDIVPSFDTVLAYGNALLKLNRSREAGAVLQDLLNRIRRDKALDREFLLMQRIADIHFSLEEYAPAFEQYVHIINRYAGLGEYIDWARKQQSMINARNQQGAEVKSFAALMLADLTYNPDRDGFKVVRLAEEFVERFSESPAVPTVNRILFETRPAAEKWFDRKLQQLNQLKNEKKYAEALQLVEQLPLQELPPDKRTAVSAITDELIAARFQEGEARRLEQEAALEKTWDRGQEHLRAREYDQAIAAFTELLDTPYGERAREQIDEAANLSAREDRRKAAELFVRANSAADPQSRLNLLVESRRLLQDILVKYPDSDVVDKVRNNLDRIEQEIRTVDPSLLSAPATDVAP